MESIEPNSETSIELYLQNVLENLRHYLPSQSPLKDFIHHNTLHAFQNYEFHKACQTASEIFGYKTYLSLQEFRKLYSQGRISREILDRVIRSHTGSSIEEEIQTWKDKLLNSNPDPPSQERIGRLRREWKNIYHINLEKTTHTFLFRLVSSYLDQGIATLKFPMFCGSFLESVRTLENLNPGLIFQSPRARNFLMNKDAKLSELLTVLVGYESLFEIYLFDQQFAHPGWSGMVALLEKKKEGLLEFRPVSLYDFIFIECLLEIEFLDLKFKENWAPLGFRISNKPEPLFAPPENREYFTLLKLWQEALEWNYFDQVLAGLQLRHTFSDSVPKSPSFQAVFCIDDRECSIRRYLEMLDPNCMTYGTPGFFNVPIYFQPQHSKFSTQCCPISIKPRYLIKEFNSTKRHKRDFHLSRHTHGILRGWILSHILGIISMFRLTLNIFFPTRTKFMVSSFDHMDPKGRLTIENVNSEDREGSLQVGFTIEEMADCLEGQLRSIGLIDQFAPLIYIVGHGSSSVNNTHYAGYDCGACSGRPGSVNARILASMGNHPNVRKILESKGIAIPDYTQFLGALHDTCRDEIVFFDEEILSEENKYRHVQNIQIFQKALAYNAKERSRRFLLINTRSSPEKIHKKVKLRSLSLFEPRPELNHATNCLCIVGRRNLSKHLFLDRRSFLNSYDPEIDKDGNLLFPILKAVAPVCGGINLEYYFSRTDNERLGAGSKLPHNVVGLIGVANGTEGDLRTGLPLQMIEIHEPIRLLVVVEQEPDLVLQVIQREASTYEWFKNHWIHLASVHPRTKEIKIFAEEVFQPYTPIQKTIPKIERLETLIESNAESFPVMQIL